jgi:hypothetical protein
MLYAEQAIGTMSRTTSLDIGAEAQQAAKDETNEQGTNHIFFILPFESIASDNASGVKSDRLIVPTT